MKTKRRKEQINKINIKVIEDGLQPLRYIYMYIYIYMNKARDINANEYTY